MLGYSGDYKYSVVSSWTKSLSYNFSVRYCVFVDAVELESLFQEHLYGLLDGIVEKPLLHDVRFFKIIRAIVFFIAREYATFILIDGTNQLIQIQRAIKSIRNKLSTSL